MFYNLIKETNINEYLKAPILDGIELLNAQNCTINFPLHKHETYNISLITKNNFHTDLIDRSFVASVGSIAITNPNELHATPCDSEIGNSFITFYVPPTLIKHLVGTNNIKLKKRVIYDKKLFSDFLWLSKKQHLLDVRFEIFFFNSLSVLLTKSGLNKNDNRFDDSLRLFLKELIVNEENFSLTAIASKYGINKYKFIRLFKQETGLTPKQFVILKRIDKSKSLLRCGRPIFDVAIDCGFYDNAHFYKYFKQYTGVNPLEFQSTFVS
ncbi:AraC family transcriptional regulator [uncultured Croceitalea sp.]|uniref:AraC family transcriptional regulator n=1 Tax=uncultured Croceitalea sp. TaxID=1798908 RepID=UPI00374F21B0